MSVNASGAVLTLDHEAMKPVVTLAPAPSVAFRLSFTAVTAGPVRDHFVSHPRPAVRPDGKPKRRFQPFSAEALSVT
ncbi:hypothetical protein [Streptomyces sp. NBC_01264]|uniref:hypothetical protein n=1 Tax=Streptomyces sp. NBC_01264 TaxID=2903804 RepID=UPI0022560C20|nr:hypothetical protein [Streptomyces sp. NBC_01264]MCX4775694.1 hypothetical protein [Streptomyces sp. NBC_01264]